MGGRLARWQPRGRARPARPLCWSLTSPSRGAEGCSRGKRTAAGTRRGPPPEKDCRQRRRRLGLGASPGGRAGRQRGGQLSSGPGRPRPDSDRRREIRTPATRPACRRSDRLARPVRPGPARPGPARPGPDCRDHQQRVESRAGSRPGPMSSDIRRPGPARPGPARPAPRAAVAGRWSLPPLAAAAAADGGTASDGGGAGRSGPARPRKGTCGDPRPPAGRPAGRRRPPAPCAPCAAAGGGDGNIYKLITYNLII